MKKIRNLAIALAFTAVGAFANDHLTQIRDLAGTLENEFRSIHVALKSKTFDSADVKSRVERTDDDVKKLESLAVDFGASSPSLAIGPDWNRTKDLVALIAIFHEQKSQLLGDMKKNRGMLRVHAEGLSKRAGMLQASASQMLKTTGP